MSHDHNALATLILDIRNSPGWIPSASVNVLPLLDQASPKGKVIAILSQARISAFPFWHLGQLLLRNIHRYKTFEAMAATRPSFASHADGCTATNHELSIYPGPPHWPFGNSVANNAPQDEQTLGLHFLNF